MTGTRVPALSPEDYPGDANIELLAQIAPMVYRKDWSNPTGLRKRLAPFLITYLIILAAFVLFPELVTAPVKWMR